MLKKLNDKEYSLGTYFLPKIKNVAKKINEVIDFLNSSNYTSSGETLYASDYGVVADGTTDDTAAFNSFMAACKAGQLKGELPKGTVLLNSKPNNIDFPWDLGGKGINGTVIKRNYSQAGSTGCLNLVDNSSASKIHDMAIESAAGTTGGSLISVVSSASFAVSGVILENLWLSTMGSDTHTNTIIFDGSAKTSAPNGVRDTSLQNVHVFGATGVSVLMTSVSGFSWFGGGIYPAGGTSTLSGGVQITGTSSNKSTYVTMDLPTTGGLNLTYTEVCKLSICSIGVISGVSINNDTSCRTTQVIGEPAGTVVGNWISSGIRRPGAAYSTT